MTADFIIIGQGIAGTWLSYELMQQGYSVMVIDDPEGKPSSRVAGALINPVNVNRGTIVNNAVQMMTTTRQQYRSLENLLHISCYRETELIVWNDQPAEKDFVPDMFVKKLSGEEQAWLQLHFSGGQADRKIAPVGCINVSLLLHCWKEYLQENNAFTAATVAAGQIQENLEGIRWNDFSARRIIFCTGASAMNQFLFRHLPFTHNRGDMLMLEIPGLQSGWVFHAGHLRLIPMREGVFWCGSNYRWDYNDLNPDMEWRNQTEKLLRKWLRDPFIIQEHCVAERPTVAGQQPVYGFLKDHPRIGIFNGLGTRGFSLAPILARQLVTAIQQNNVALI